MKWVYQRVGIVQVQQTFYMQRQARRCISEAKSEQKALETPTSLAHRAQRSVPENRTLDKTIVYRREKAPTALCADAPWHEYEWQERRLEVRKVGIRIPGHIRPPLASSSNSFGMSHHQDAPPYLHSRDVLSVVT